MEHVLDLHQFFRVRFEHPLQGNARPDRNDRRDVLLVHRFLQEAVVGSSAAFAFFSPFAAAPAAAEVLLFKNREILFRLRQLAVGDLRHALQIALALGDLRFALQVVHFLPKLVQCFKFYLFRMPLRSKARRSAL